MMKHLTNFKFLGLGLMVFFLLSGCDEIQTGPSKVAKEFLTALNHGDFDKAKELATPSSRLALGLIGGVSAFTGELSRPFKITGQEREGDYAKVFYKDLDTDREYSLRLSKHNNKGWLVNFKLADFAAEEDIERALKDPDKRKQIEEGLEELGEGLDSLGKVLGKGLQVIGSELEKFGKKLEEEIEKVEKEK